MLLAQLLKALHPLSSLPGPTALVVREGFLPTCLKNVACLCSHCLWHDMPWYNLEAPCPTCPTQAIPGATDTFLMSSLDIRLCRGEATMAPVAGIRLHRTGSAWSRKYHRWLPCTFYALIYGCECIFLCIYKWLHTCTHKYTHIHNVYWLFLKYWENKLWIIPKASATL